MILTRAGALTRLFARFEAMLAERGFRQGDGEIVDATVVEARRPRPRCPLDRQVRPQGQAARGWAPGVPPNGVHERPATRLFEASDCLRSPPSGLRLRNEGSLVRVTRPLGYGYQGSVPGASDPPR